MKRNFAAFTKTIQAQDLSYKAFNLAKARETKRIKRDYLKQYPKGYKFTTADKDSIIHIFYQIKRTHCSNLYYNMTFLT